MGQIGTCLTRSAGGLCYRELLPDVSHFRSENQHRQILSRSGSIRVEPPIGSTIESKGLNQLPHHCRPFAFHCTAGRIFHTFAKENSSAHLTPARLRSSVVQRSSKNKRHTPKRKNGNQSTGKKGRPLPTSISWPARPPHKTQPESFLLFQNGVGKQCNIKTVFTILRF